MPQVEHRAAVLQQQVASLQQQLQDARELPRKLRRDFQQVGHTVCAHVVSLVVAATAFLSASALPTDSQRAPLQLVVQ